MSLDPHLFKKIKLFNKCKNTEMSYSKIKIIQSCYKKKCNKNSKNKKLSQNYLKD